MANNDLPAVPGFSAPPQPGVSRVIDYLSNREPDPYKRAAARAAAAAPTPITADTPRATLQRRASNIAYGYSPGNANRQGPSFQTGDQLGTQQRTFPGDAARPFLRPPTGPGSAASVALAADPTTPKLAVGNLPVRPMLARVGSVTPLAAAPAAVPAPGAGMAGTQALPDTNVIAPASVAAPGVDSGTTIRRPDGSTAKLNYGAMVNGVPTFSDGSGMPAGSPGAIPRTVSDATLTRLASAPSISRADVGALGTALATDGQGGTPTQEQMVQRLVRAAPRPITGSRPSPEQFAASDLAAIASGDPRSALGTAASNLRSEAAYARTPRLRRMAESQLQQLTGGVAQLGQQGVQGEQAQVLGQQQGDQAMALENQRGANQLADTAMQLRRPQPVQLVQQADGTYAGVDTRTNTAAPTIGPDGKPLRGMATRDDAATRRTQEIQDQLAKTAGELAKNWLPDPKNPSAAPPFALYREQAAQAAGLPVVKNSAGEKLVNINGQWMPL